VGLGDFFKRRAQRESAIPSSAGDPEPLGSFASPEGQPVVGKQVGGGAPQISGDLGDLAGMLAGFQAMAGSVQIEQGDPQTIDMRGTGLREEILGIMREHGIDAESGTAQQVDASAMPEMQRQILEALARRGINPGA
jgi:hypothetical protein